MYVPHASHMLLWITLSMSSVLVILASQNIPTQGLDQFIPSSNPAQAL
jgi:hypothetical protein